MPNFIRLEVSPLRGTTNLGKYTLPKTLALAVKTLLEAVNAVLK